MISYSSLRKHPTSSFHFHTFPTLGSYKKMWLNTSFLSEKCLQTIGLERNVGACITVATKSIQSAISNAVDINQHRLNVF